MFALQPVEKPMWEKFRKESADSILRALGMSTPPVDPFAVASQLGAKLYVVPDAQWDGALEVKDVPHIYIKGKAHLNRQRFTCAHELGHLILHDLTVAWRDKFEKGKKPRVEKEADAFAAELLMPAWMMQAYVPFTSYEDLPKLFGVSKQSMSIRLSNLGLYARPRRQATKL